MQSTSQIVIYFDPETTDHPSNHTELHHHLLQHHQLLKLFIFLVNELWVIAIHHHHLCQHKQMYYYLLNECVVLAIHLHQCQIDTEKLGLMETDKYKNININSSNGSNGITKATATPMGMFLPSNSSKKIPVSRMADGVSSRHIVVISRDSKAYSMGSNQRGQLGLAHFKSTLNFDKVHFKLSSTDMDNSVAFVLMPKCMLPIKKILHYYYYILYDVRGGRNKQLFSTLYSLVSSYIISSQSLLSGDPRGRLYVCGCNNFGQLGIGNNENSNGQQCVNISQRVMAGGLANAIAQVSCGENHTVCLENHGRVYCFGDNYYGQSGSHMNHYENVYYPLKIQHFKQQYQARIVKISSGKYYCVALDKLGRVFCSGLGAYGQLGCNKLNKRIIFTQIFKSLSFLFDQFLYCTFFIFFFIFLVFL